MTKSQVKKIINKILPDLQRALHLDNWKINIEYVEIAPDDLFVGKCHRDEKRQHAVILLCYELLQTKSEVKETLLHELLHIVNAAYDVINDVIDPMLDDTEKNVFNVIRNRASEPAVLALENMLKSMGLNVKDIIALNRRSSIIMMNTMGKI